MKAVEGWSVAQASIVERKVILNVMGPSNIYSNKLIAEELTGIAVVPPGKLLPTTAPLSMPICTRQNKKVRVCPFVCPSICSSGLPIASGPPIQPAHLRSGLPGILLSVFLPDPGLPVSSAALRRRRALSSASLTPGITPGP